MKFKVGDKCQVVGGHYDQISCGHGFPLGTIVKVREMWGDEHCYECNYLDDSDSWFCKEEDLSLYVASTNHKEEVFPTKGKSDGGPSEYYDFPTNCTTLNDLIEYKEMSFAHGNIFKAAYRLGHKDGISLEYDLNKIIYYANRMLEQLKGKPDGK
jgi:hypothetical protein